MSDFLKGFNQENYKKDDNNPSKTKNNLNKAKTRSGKVETKETVIPADAREEVFERDPDSIKRNRIKRILIVSGVLAACFLIGLLYYFSRLVKLPDFVGGHADHAQAWAARNNIYIEVEEEYSLEYNRGLVVFQSPGPQETLFKGRSMKMAVSMGPDPKERIELPDFATMGVYEIDRWIYENKAGNVIINRVYDDTVPANRFIRVEFRDPSVTEQNYRREDRMTILISRGPEEIKKDIEVPDFRDKPESDASQWANSAGITLNIEYAYSDTIRESFIISQSITPKTKIAQNQDLTVTVSRGRAIYVPSFSRLSKEEAAITAAAAGISISLIDHYHNSVQAGSLISQSIEAGTLLKEGQNTIVLYYSLGKPYIPDLAGRNKNEVVQFFAEMNSKKASLQYKVNYLYSSGTPKGTVIMNSHAGSIISTGSTITITVSLGGRIKVYIDDYIGRDFFSEEMQDEIARLEELGLRVIYDTVESDEAGGTILYQSIAQGEHQLSTTDDFLLLEVAE